MHANEERGNFLILDNLLAEEGEHRPTPHSTQQTTERILPIMADGSGGEMDTERRTTLKQILDGAPVWNSNKDVDSDNEADAADDSVEIERLKKEAELVGILLKIV